MKTKKEIVQKAIEKYEKLCNSEELDYKLEKVKIKNNMYLYIEAVRFEPDDVDDEEDIGTVFNIEAWVEKNGEPIEGINTVMDPNEFEYLVNVVL